MSSDFDSSAARYAEIVNTGARASGESYEFMVDLRIALFRSEVESRVAVATRPWILDFGCGTGYTLERLSPLFPTARLEGFDTSSESVQMGRARQIPRSGFSCAEKIPLPYPDQSFDAVYSNGTFHHIDPAERGVWLRELQRVTRPSGAVLIFENNPFNPLMMQAMRRTPFDADATPVRAASLAALLRGAGFHVRRVRYYFFFPRLLKWLRCCEKSLGGVPLGAQYFIHAVKG